MTMRRGNAITEYLILAVAIILGMSWLKSAMQTRTQDLMNTAVQQVPIVP